MTLDHRLLIVDNSIFFRDVLAQTLVAQLKGLQVDSVKTCHEAEQLMAKNHHSYMAVISGLVLEDALPGEMLKVASRHGIPAIALTSSLDSQTRQKVMDLNVIDYFFKDQDGLVDVISLIKRLMTNGKHKILVVDDSSTYCSYLKVLLERQHYQVILATTGEQAVDILGSGHDISLVLLDYELPGMSGYDVIRRIRKQYNSTELPVIGISGQIDQQIPAQILKCGGNDFMYKGFTVEEFYSRINNMMDLLQSVRELKDAAYKDFLTGMPNRQYFYPTADSLIAQSDSSELQLGLVMMDIDHFKKVNDSYGHSAGDDVLKAVADAIRKESTSKMLMARLGGEEFCLLTQGFSEAQLLQRMERLRALIEAIDVVVLGQTLKVTLSMGVRMRNNESLEDLMEQADKALYVAKESGRNRIDVFQPELA